jgi:hypothetical protein
MRCTCSSRPQKIVTFSFLCFLLHQKNIPHHYQNVGEVGQDRVRGYSDEKGTFFTNYFFKLAKKARSGFFGGGGGGFKRERNGGDEKWGCPIPPPLAYSSSVGACEVDR